MNNNMPRTPFSMSLSRSAKETELRIRNIMSGPKKRPPLPFLILMFSVCIFCGNLVSCNVTEMETPASSQPAGSSQIVSPQPSQKPEPLPVPLPTPDLNGNGIPEEIRFVNEYGWEEVRFYENGQLLNREIPDVYLCTLDGVDYLLRYYNDAEYPGALRYSYTLSTFSEEFEEPTRWNNLSFDLGFGAPFHSGFDPKTIAAFVDELNGLFSHSVRLSVRDGEGIAETVLPETLDFLDDFPDMFTRDPDKSLEENLRDFQAAMPPDWTPPAPEPGAKLPFDQPMKLEFSSGAGAWRTELTLNPDGSFTGDYCDADMELQYVCQFHGRFGSFVRLSDASWYMVLEVLVLDTKYPVGTEWDEGSYHYISITPYGFDSTDGAALNPGAGFILYTPEATGHQPGTELYGAYEFWTWWPDRRPFRTAADTLGCWGLHNLTSGYGFFSVT